MESNTTAYAFKNLNVDMLHPFLYQARTWFDQDELQQMTIRVATVSNDPRFPDSDLRNVPLRLERGDGYEVEEAELEIL